MIKLAIVGNIASGKSLIESLFQEQGIITIDSDKIVHELLAKNKEIINKINNLFDVDVIDKKGQIDRKKVGNIVFNDKHKLCQLEKIIHPEVKKTIEQFFQNNVNEKIVAVSVPQLYESGWEAVFDYVIFVTADDDIRLKRLIKRNNLAENQAKQRLSAQLPQEEKAKKADFVIENSGDIKNTKLQLEEILNKLKNIPA